MELNWTSLTGRMMVLWEAFSTSVVFPDTVYLHHRLVYRGKHRSCVNVCVAKRLLNTFPSSGKQSFAAEMEEINVFLC